MKVIDPFKWIKRYIELLSYKWPPRDVARKKARRKSQLPDKRVKWESQCAHCKKWFRESGTHLDHIVPKGRSEERRVGKECRSRWSPYH